jgi:hypothetical protein
MNGSHSGCYASVVSILSSAAKFGIKALTSSHHVIRGRICYNTDTMQLAERAALLHIIQWNDFTERVCAGNGRQMSRELKL